MGSRSGLPIRTSFSAWAEASSTIITRRCSAAATADDRADPDVSPAGELRFALFDVGFEPLLRILRGPELGLELTFECQCLLEAHLETRLHGALDLAHRKARFVGRHETPRVFDDFELEIVA